MSIFLSGVCTGVTGEGFGRNRPFSFAKDIERLAAKIEALGDVAAVFIDPITAYLGEGIDSHKNSDIRALLAPLADIAAKSDVAIIAVSHLNKSTGGRAIMKVSGSLAFVAVARAVYLVAEDPEDKGRRLFLPIKNNLGPDSTGLAFRIEAATLQSLNGPIETSKIVWQNEIVTQSADQIFSASNGEHSERRDAAMQFLQELLADGAMSAIEVEKAVEGCQHSRRTIQRASDALRIEKFKKGMDGGWFWQLPLKNAKLHEDSHL